VVQKVLILPLKSGSMLVVKSTLYRFNVGGEGWFIVSGEGGSMWVAIYMVKALTLNVVR